MKSPDSSTLFVQDPTIQTETPSDVERLIVRLLSHPEVRERYLADMVVGEVTDVIPLDGGSVEACTRFEIKYLIDGVLPAAGVVRKVDAKYAFTALGSMPTTGFSIVVLKNAGIPQKVITYPSDGELTDFSPVFEVEATVDAIEAEQQLVKTILAAAPALLDSEHPSQRYVQ